MENNELLKDLLKIRENKRSFIEKNINNYQIITLRANIPGSDKNILISYILINLFDHLITKSYKYEKKYINKSLDGVIIYYFFNKELPSLKEEMMKLENNHPLGRFMDIDVYYQSVTSLSRNALRKCYLCDNPAFVCGKNKTHNINDLVEYINKETINYFKNIFENIFDQAMTTELNLENKFGLVTPSNSGSHKDMDYQLMKNAKDAIKKEFIRFFEAGIFIKDNNELFLTLRTIGKEIENIMYQKTLGVNAYKGLIFAGGFISASIARYLLDVEKNYSVSDYCKKLSEHILDELKEDSDTFGKVAFQKYGFLGARGQAWNGYINVLNVIKKYPYMDSNKLDILIEFIKTTDDTILLKRCGSIEKYQKVKEMFISNQYDIKYLNEYCIKNNLSFGGAADLLIIYEVLNRFNQVINIF